MTVGDVLRTLRAAAPAGWSPSAVRGAVSALGLYARHGGDGADAASAPFDRASVRAFLSGNTAAALGVSDATLRAYASHLRALLDTAGGAGRPAQIRDIEGPWRKLFDSVALLDVKRDLVYAAGPFLAWCAAEGLRFGDVDADTVVAWRDHRLAHGKVTVTAARHIKTARRARALWNHLARIPACAALGVRAVAQPFPDGRVRYAMPADMLAPILAEFDQRVVPWVKGEATPEGRRVDEVLDELAAAPAQSAKIAAARTLIGAAPRNRRSGREARLRACGVLLAGATWGPARIRVARAGVVSLVKALWTRTGARIETMAELADPDLLEAAAEALAEATDPEGLGSSYVSGLLKLVRKVACGFVGSGADEIDRIDVLIGAFTPDFVGISPRNKRKLQQFTPARIAAFFAMSGQIIGEVNAALARRKAAIARARAEGLPEPALIDAAIAGKLELVVAHDIFCARAPRSANLLGIDLGRHVRTGADGCVVIELPPEMVKNAKALTIPLNAAMSAVFRRYVATVRPVLLTDANRDSTMLFPARMSGEGHYSALTDKLMREIHTRVGVRFHPHLYRHLLGWTWLKEDPGALPKVQILLGHKDLKTTLKFYVDLDETLALQAWSDHLEDRSNGAVAA
jgi:site-specific recombinase XerD